MDPTFRPQQVATTMPVRDLAVQQATLCLGSEAVDRLAVALQCVNDVERRHRLALRVLRVRDGVLHRLLEKLLENPTSLLVDETRDALDTTAASQAPDCRLRNSLNVFADDLAMALGSGLALATLSLSAHLLLEQTHLS